MRQLLKVQKLIMVKKTIAASDETFSGFVFKIQANMNPAHRDRIAFVRIKSGEFRKGWTLH